MNDNEGDLNDKLDMRQNQYGEGDNNLIGGDHGDHLHEQNTDLGNENDNTLFIPEDEEVLDGMKDSGMDNGNMDIMDNVEQLDIDLINEKCDQVLQKHTNNKDKENGNCNDNDKKISINYKT